MASLAQTKNCSINVCFVCLLTFCVLIFSSSYTLWAFNDTLGLFTLHVLIYNYFSALLENISDAEDGSWDEFYYQLCLKIILGYEGQEFVAMQLLRRRTVKQRREENNQFFKYSPLRTIVTFKFLIFKPHETLWPEFPRRNPTKQIQHSVAWLLDRATTHEHLHSMREL